MSHASAVLEQPLEILLHRWERHLLRLSPRLAGSLAHPCGDTQLRRALAARYSTAVDQCWNADNLYLGVDAASVLRLLILALALKGQTVVVVTPCPWPLLRALRDAGVQVLELALCDRGRIDLQWLEPQLKGGRVRLMLLDSRVNLPHGTLMPLAQRRALGRLLVHYGTWLLEHDGGGELCFSETPRLRELIDPQRLLILGSLEQGIGAEGGYGYLMSRHFAPSLRQVFLQRACRLPPIRQQAIARLFDGGQVDAHLQRLRCLWQVRLGTWQQQLDRHLAEHVEYTRPKGGTGLWLRCRQPVNGRRLFERLVQRRIVVTPGELFSLRGDFSQCLLLACPDLSEAQHEALWPVVAEVLAREGRES
nr:aminotransferase class I/II-fold pyridoxal phosphate-dependent enzyme [Pseudomonas sp. dw_358]